MKVFTLICALNAFLIPHLPVQAQDEVRQSIKTMANELSTQILASDKKRVAVINFLNLQGNVTELGRFVAERFNVGLTNGKLEVINCNQLEQLIKDRKMLKDGLLDPKGVAELGWLANVDVVVTGTISPLGKTVDITASAIGVERGVNVGAADGSIPRTEDINDLLRSQVSGENAGNSTTTTPFIPGGMSQSSQNISQVLMGDKLLEMQKSECIQNNLVFGRVYFENRLKDDLVLYMANGRSSQTPFKIAAGTRNNFQLLNVSNETKVERSADYIFYFHTAEDDESKWRYGTMSVTVKGCKATVRVINANRIYLGKQR